MQVYMNKESCVWLLHLMFLSTHYKNNLHLLEKQSEHKKYEEQQTRFPNLINEAVMWVIIYEIWELVKYLVLSR